MITEKDPNSRPYALNLQSEVSGLMSGFVKERVEFTAKLRDELAEQRKNRTQNVAEMLANFANNVRNVLARCARI